VLAFGELGMSVADFYASTPRQFTNRLSGYFKKQDRVFREEWERTRVLLVQMVRPHLKKSEQRKSVNQIYPLPWDKKVVKEKITKEKANAFWNRIDSNEAE